MNYDVYLSEQKKYLRNEGYETFNKKSSGQMCFWNCRVGFMIDVYIMILELPNTRKIEVLQKSVQTYHIVEPGTRWCSVDRIISSRNFNIIEHEDMYVARLFHRINRVIDMFMLLSSYASLSFQRWLSFQ